MRPDLSIILPLYNEAATLPLAVEALCKEVRPLNLSFEILLVDDGSTDATWQAVESLHGVVPEVRALALSRNFGKEAALRAGLNEARGKALLFMDADLQHPPNLIPKMIRAWRDSGAEIVSAVKRSRGLETPFHRASAEFFGHVVERLSGMELRGSSDFKLINQAAADLLRSMPETDFFFRGMCVWSGFKQEKIEFDVPRGLRPESRWSLYKKARFFFNGITTFSTLPLQIVTLSGFVFLLFALGLGAQTLYMKVSGQALDGFSTVILLLLFIGSILMLGLGIIGAYIATIFNEVKRRPVYIISKELKAPAVKSAANQ